MKKPEDLLKRGTGNFFHCTDYEDAIEAMKEYGRQCVESALTTPVDVQEVDKLALVSKLGLLIDDFGSGITSKEDTKLKVLDIVGNLDHTTAQPSQWEKALVSLTPGGSEFAGDPERCVDWVREHIKSIAEIAKNSIKEKRQPSQWMDCVKELLLFTESDGTLVNGFRTKEILLKLHHQTHPHQFLNLKK